MKLYTINDLNQGSGVFDHIMRASGEYPSHHTAMPSEVGIGVLAAAMQSGLTHADITEVLSCYFDESTAEMLDNIRGMYEGKDHRIHLWSADSKGAYAVNQSLRWYSKPRWRIERPAPAYPYYA